MDKKYIHSQIQTVKTAEQAINRRIQPDVLLSKVPAVSTSSPQTKGGAAPRKRARHGSDLAVLVPWLSRAPRCLPLNSTQLDSYQQLSSSFFLPISTTFIASSTPLLSSQHTVCPPHTSTHHARRPGWHLAGNTRDCVARACQQHPQ
jgi:hypothetical protein